jgi:exopolysaccharide biosynthesis predicted pyruvyltransferase EpsI
MLNGKVNDFYKQLYTVVNTHINRDYVLLGVPKHMNLGDSLIW